jgi:hypothetical protein
MVISNRFITHTTLHATLQSQSINSDTNETVQTICTSTTTNPTNFEVKLLKRSSLNSLSGPSLPFASKYSTFSEVDSPILLNQTFSDFFMRDSAIELGVDFFSKFVLVANNLDILDNVAPLDEIEEGN